MSEASRDLLVCAAALLEQGRTVDRLSRPLTAGALIGILVYPAISTQPPLMPIGFAVLVALAGLAEAYFAIRVGFDAALFRQLGSGPEEPDFSGTDAVLTRMGLVSAQKAGRTADARVAGAKRLFRFQILSVTLQVLIVLAGTGLVLMWR